MVERDLAKVETRVRFSSPAPFKAPSNEGAVCLLITLYNSLLVYLTVQTVYVREIRVQIRKKLCRMEVK